MNWHEKCQKLTKQGMIRLNIAQKYCDLKNYLSVLYISFRLEGTNTLKKYNCILKLANFANKVLWETIENALIRPLNSVFDLPILWKQK